MNLPRSLSLSLSLSWRFPYCSRSDMRFVLSFFVLCVLRKRGEMNEKKKEREKHNWDQCNRLC